WAGANNPLWYVKDGKIKEIKADKQPIGKYVNSLPFTTHLLEFSEADSIYLFSDGYADQFGGPKGKKFKYSQLETAILSNLHLAPEEKRSTLNALFESWKGQLEQIDDVCVIGIDLK